MTLAKDLYEDFGGKIAECECGQRFIPGGDWVYKISGGKHGRTKYFCSYSCWRKAGGGSGKDPRYVSKRVK